MATADIVHQDWTAIEHRALELFTEHRNLEWDDSILAALLMERAPALAVQALNLIENDGNCSLSHAFKAVQMTERLFSDEPLPFEERRAA